MSIFRDGFAWNWVFLKSKPWTLVQDLKRVGETSGEEDGEEEAGSEMQFLDRRGAKDLDL